MSVSSKSTDTVHNPLTNVNTALEITPQSSADKEVSIFDWMHRTNLFLLFLCFALVMTCSTLLISTVPLAAEEIGISKEFATLTIGLYLFGAAVSASISSRLFSKFGRFLG